MTTTLMTAFVVRERLLNDQNYPYYADLTMWGSAEDARESLESEEEHGDVLIIVARNWNLHESGRIMYKDVTIFEHGRWVDSQYDPRMKNPRFLEYLELKKEFEGEG